MQVCPKKRYRLWSSSFRRVCAQTRGGVPSRQGREGLFQNGTPQARQRFNQEETCDQTQAEKMSLQTQITMPKQPDAKGQPVVLAPRTNNNKNENENVYYNHTNTYNKQHDTIRFKRGVFVLNFD